MIDSQIPFDCRAAELEHLDEDLARKIRNGVGMHGALLYGGTGAGKTFAMIAAMKAVSRAMPARALGPNVILDGERNTLCSFVDWPDFIASIGPNGDAVSARQLLGWRGPLFLDDVGQEHFAATGYKQGIAEAIFDRFVARHTGAGLPLWITTNLTPNEIATRYGERAMSRLMGWCVPIKLEGQDRRLS